MLGEDRDERPERAARGRPCRHWLRRESRTAASGSGSIGAGHSRARRRRGRRRRRAQALGQQHADEAAAAGAERERAARSRASAGSRAPSAGWRDWRSRSAGRPPRPPSALQRKPHLVADDAIDEAIDGRAPALLDVGIASAMPAAIELISACACSRETPRFSRATAPGSDSSAPDLRRKRQRNLEIGATGARTRWRPAAHRSRCRARRSAGWAADDGRRRRRRG